MGIIDLKQYDGSQIMPVDDAILYDMIVGQNGIIKGCELTLLENNQIHIGAGYGIIKGRLFEITEHTVYAKLPTSSTCFGYLVIILDLSNIDEPIKIDTCTYTSAVTEDNWTQDENINTNNGIWEMPIAEYTATSIGITEFVDMTVKVKRAYTTIKEFDEWEAVEEEGNIVDAVLEKKRILTFENKILNVEEGNYDIEETCGFHPLVVDIDCLGVDSNYVPYITAPPGRENDICPYAVAKDGKISIYYNSNITENITIPVIQCIRKMG